MDGKESQPSPAMDHTPSPVVHAESHLLSAPSTCDLGYASTPELDHNPEAPSELLDREDLISADKIGDTVYSKHWLFTNLMKLIEVVEKKNREEAAEENGEKKEGEEKERYDFDFDDEFQDELCQLWDMSMNKEVVNFLQEFKAVDILTGVIAKSQYPRVTEICVGILGNMGCADEACREMAAKKKLIDLVALLLSEVDAPTLVETMRLLLTVISNTSHRGPWLEMIKTEGTFVTRVTFMLCSSTNDDLLRNIAMFLDKLLDIEEGLCSSWATSEMIAALIEAAKQIGCRPGEALDTLFHVLQLFSTSEKGVTVLVEKQEELCHLFLQYLLRICSDEIPGVEGHENSLASAFSILNVVFVSSPEAQELIFQDHELIRCLLKILEVVYTKLHPERHRDYLSRRRRSRTRSRYVSATQSSPPKNITDNGHEVQTDGTEGEGATSTIDRVQETDVASGDTLNEEKESTVPNKPLTEPEQGSGDHGNAGNVVMGTSDGDPGKLVGPEEEEKMKEEEKKVEEEEEEEEEDYDVTRLCVLYEVLHGFVQDVTAIFTSAQREEVARSLLYFETGCPRDRLYCMVWSLIDENLQQEPMNAASDNSANQPTSKGLRLVAALREMAEKHELRRLTGILEDAVDLYPDSRRRVSQ